jgi:glucose-6-phosphate 1-epimerase
MNLAEQLQTLYQQFGQLPGITIELHKELIAINVRNPQAQATVFLQGAQLSHYQPTGQQPVIWCSSLCEYLEAQPLRGGIPVCWPWFGDPTKNPDVIKQQFPNIEGLPAHGLVRGKEWQLDSVDTSRPEVTVLTLSLNVNGANEPLWPFNTELKLTLAIGAELDAQLTISNCDVKPFSFSTALHSYLAMSDCEQASIEGLEDCSYLDTVADDSSNNWIERKQNGPVRIDREIDRLYVSAPKRTHIIDQGWQRQLILDSTGSNSTVVWNPWIEKAKRLSCFDENAYREMICIETANVIADSVTLEPGTQHQLGVCIHCTTL